jgi:hypothetical protein
MKPSYKTRAGSTVVLLTDTAVGERPLVGAYYSGEQWIPCSWLGNGQYKKEQQSSLDIIDF